MSCSENSQVDKAFLKMANLTDTSLSGPTDEAPLPPLDESRQFVRTAQLATTRWSATESYLTFNVGPRPMRRLVIKTWSRDQEQSDPQRNVGDPHAGSHNGFSLGTIPDDNPDCSGSGELYVVEQHVKASSKERCHTVEWSLDAPFSGESSEVRVYLKSVAATPGIKIGVFPFAHNPGWVNLVLRVMVRVYDAPDDAPPLPMSPILQKIFLHQIYPNWLDKTTSDARQRPPPNYTQLRHYLSGLESSRGPAEISQHLQTITMAICSTPEDASKIGELCHKLASVYMNQFHETKELNLLHQAIEGLERASQIMPPGHSQLVEIWSNLGNCYEAKFGSSETSLKNDLDRAVSFRGRAICAALEAGVFDSPQFLTDFARVFFERYKQYGSIEDLNQAVEAAKDGVKLTSQDDRSRIARLEHLRDMLKRRHLRAQSMKDLGGALDLGLIVMKSCLSSSSRLSAELADLGESFGWAFHRTHECQYLDQAIGLTRKAVESSSDDESTHTVYYRRLEKYLCMRFGHTGLPEHLDQALASTFYAAEAARTSTPALGRAVEEEAQHVKAITVEHVDCVEHLAKLAKYLETRSEHMKSTSGLDLRIQTLSWAARIESQQHGPTSVSQLFSLGCCLCQVLHESPIESWDSIDQEACLKRAIQIFKTLNASITEERSKLDKGLIWHNLGFLLHLQFELCGDEQLLNEAIEAMKQAVRTPGHVESRDVLALLLRERSERTRSIKDLDDAVDVITQAIDLTSDHEPKCARLNLLAWCLEDKSTRTGSIRDLNLAIDAAAQSLEISDQAHPFKHKLSLTYLNLLLSRYKQFESEDDLDQVLSVTRRAMELMPEDDPHSCDYFNVLAIGHTHLFKRTQSENDLKSAIKALRLAIVNGPRVSKTVSLSNLSWRLIDLFKQTLAKDNLREAFEVAQEAVHITPKTNVHYGECLVALAHCFGAPFELGSSTPWQYESCFSACTSQEDYFDQAISLVNRAIESVENTDPRLSQWSRYLGHLHINRLYYSDYDGRPYEDVMSAFQRGWECTSASPWDQIISAVHIATGYSTLAGYDSPTFSCSCKYCETYRQELSEQDRQLRAQKMREKASTTTKKAVDLLSRVSIRFLKQADVLNLLRAVDGLASQAAATALDAGDSAEDALALLELGRGVSSSLMIDMRKDLSDLKLIHPTLAGRLTAIRDDLNQPLRSDITLSEQSSMSKRNQEASLQFQELLEEIRGLDGFEDFLLPPQSSKLQQAAIEGPIIVVNVHGLRCDAFLVTTGGIDLLKLPDLSSEDVRRQASVIGVRSGHTSLAQCLEWLWETICRPCLDKLGFGEPLEDNWPRVFWVPVGDLSRLPLHAAGVYKKGSKETVMDRVISSYATSIKALYHGREHRQECPSGRATAPSAVLVAMERTPGAGFQILPNAVEEIIAVKSFCPPLLLEPITPSSRKADVLAHLSDCKIFHFAGHGDSKPDPSQSLILLEDWKTDPLTVGDLREIWIRDNPPFLAYLSACSTGANKHENLSDEGVHLISGFLMAGFRHVLGTLWEVSDAQCVKVAKIVYETLVEKGQTDEAIALGLHRALRLLRDDRDVLGSSRPVLEVHVVGKQGDIPEGSTLINTQWVPYVHFGV